MTVKELQEALAKVENQDAEVTAWANGEYKYVDGLDLAEDGMSIELVLSSEDEENCPGCGCEPGDGYTEDCDHENGCGYFKGILQDIEKPENFLDR